MQINGEKDKIKHYPTISVKNYQGPINLILRLVQAKKINLIDLDLAEVSNEYIKIINQLLIICDIHLISEYLLIAATLINLKARILLKAPKTKNNFEKVKKSLLNRLTIYQQFKNIAELLRNYENQQDGFYMKKPNKNSLNFSLIIKKDIANKNITQKLIIALQQMLERISLTKWKLTIIEPLNLSPRSCREKLLKMFMETDNMPWKELSQGKSKEHFVVNWITILNMAHKQEIVIQQEKLFGPIILNKGTMHE